MVLCLNNRNRIYLNDKIFDLDSTTLSPDQKNIIGGMAIRSSRIPELDLYKLRGESGCVQIDSEKIITSKVTAEFGDVPSFVSTSTGVNGGMNVVIYKPSINFEKTLLCVRIQGWYLLALLVALLVSWSGLIVLFISIKKFVIGNKEVE